MKYRIIVGKRPLSHLAILFSKILFVGIGLVTLIILLAITLVSPSFATPTEAENIYLPAISNDPTLTPTPTSTPTPTPTPNPDQNFIQNGSFENSWTDLPPEGNLINQNPNEWQLTWVPIGEEIFGSGVISQGIPECVHRLDWQLPEDERFGGPRALILEGITTYKVFHGGAAFGVELKQVVSGLTPGQAYKLTAPIQLHMQPPGSDTDPWGAESGVWIEGIAGEWVNQGIMGDRAWYYHEYEFTAPPSGEVTILIRVKNKYPIGKDFFFDNIQLMVVSP